MDSPCGSHDINLPEKLSTLRHPKDSRLLPVIKSNSSGLPVEFVSSATGRLAFSTSDLKFGETSYLTFQRFYSNGSEDIGLGKGWSFDYSDRIILNSDKATLISRAGEKLQFVRISTKRGNKRTYASKQRRGLKVQGFQYIGDGTIVQDSYGSKKKYHKIGNKFYLSSVKDPNFRQINISRYKDGRISKISDGVNSISVDWSSRQNDKILSLSDNRGRRIHFEQKKGFLVKAYGFSGAYEQYKYQRGKLALVKDQAKSLLLNVRYDEFGRVIAANSYTHSIRYAYNWSSGSKIMKATTSGGYSIFYDHSKSGFIKHIYDAQGTLAKFHYDSHNLLTEISNDKQTMSSFEYNKDGRVIKLRNSGKSDTSLAYDSSGRIANTITNGTKTTFSYDSNGILERRKSTRYGSGAETTFDRLGRVAFIKTSAGKEIRNEYDIAGNLTVIDMSGAGRHKTSYNIFGQKIREQLPNGKIVTYQYNSSGKIAKIFDNAGYKLTAEYDSSNRVTKIFNDQQWFKIKRDKEGRITQTENSKGKKREFSYNSQGALIQFRNTKNVKYNFSYTVRGGLKELTNSKGLKIEYILDENGKATIGKKYFREKDISLETTPTNLLNDCPPIDSWGGVDPLTYGISPEDDCGDDPLFDPFVPSGGADGFGGGIGGFGNKCDQCKLDQRNACYWTKVGCGSFYFGAYLAAMAVCAALTGPAFLVCAAGASAAYAGGLGKCAANYQSCLLKVNSACSWACSKK